MCRELALRPRPILQMHRSARILIVGQTPGKKTHESGVPFNDASGDRLRKWLEISREVFYDAKQIAILPMGFCYPGTGKSGDLPPRPECAPAWRQSLLSQLKNLELTLVIGQYALAYHLPNETVSLTEVVQNPPSRYPLSAKLLRKLRWNHQRRAACWWFHPTILNDNYRSLQSKPRHFLLQRPSGPKLAKSLILLPARPCANPRHWQSGRQRHSGHAR